MLVQFSCLEINKNTNIISVFVLKYNLIEINIKENSVYLILCNKINNTSLLCISSLVYIKCPVSPTGDTSVRRN